MESMTEVPVEQTVKDLELAAKLIRREGWGQGSYRQAGTGRLCAAGALYESVGVEVYVYAGITVEEDQDLRVYAAAKALSPLLGLPAEEQKIRSPLGQVVYFNDCVCRGGEELALLFDQAREKLEAEL